MKSYWTSNNEDNEVSYVLVKIFIVHNNNYKLRNKLIINRIYALGGKSIMKGGTDTNYGRGDFNFI